MRDETFRQAIEVAETLGDEGYEALTMSLSLADTPPRRWGSSRTRKRG